MVEKIIMMIYVIGIHVYYGEASVCLSQKVITFLNGLSIFQEGPSLTPFDDADVMMIMEVVVSDKDEKSK